MHARESFRHVSMISAACRGVILGVWAGFVSFGDRIVYVIEGLEGYQIELIVGYNNLRYMLKHTKIVATVSDQRCDVAFVEALYKAGMNVVRLNTAHMMEEG